VQRRTPGMPAKGGHWDDDFDVSDGDRDVGRIYRSNAHDEVWFWGLSFEFQLTVRKRYGHATSLDEAKAAFAAECIDWKTRE
jgi:hypothetical protein